MFSSATQTVERVSARTLHARILLHSSTEGYFEANVSFMETAERKK